MEVQHQTVPKTYRVRITLENPTFETLSEAINQLRWERVPNQAWIEFHRWNTPNTNWYIIAEWEDASDS